MHNPFMPLKYAATPHAGIPRNAPSIVLPILFLRHDMIPNNTPYEYQRRRKFYYILCESPANNAPYLSGTGRFITLVFGLLCIASILSGWFATLELTVFFAASAASTAFILSSSYAALLLSWKALQTGHFRIQTSVPESHVCTGRKFEVSCTMSNALSWHVLFDAIFWDHTNHIDIMPSTHLRLAVPPKSEVNIGFTAKACDVGPAGIIGIGLVMGDAMHLFRAEAHIEQNISIDVGIRPLSSKQSSANASSNRAIEFAQLLKSTFQSVSPEDYEDVRPFQRGDSMRRIAWRGYARHQELTVRHGQHTSQRHIIGLVDAGPHMRLPYAGFSHRCHLVAFAELCEQIADQFDSFTLLAYDENNFYAISLHEQASQTIKQINDWLIIQLSWMPPKGEKTACRQVWMEFANRLWKDFKLYRHVDFSSPKGRDRQIDLSSMTSWAKTDWVAEALKQGDRKAAVQLSQMQYHDIMQKLSRQRRRWANQSLLPHAPSANLKNVLPTIESSLKRDDSAVLIWFSDFCAPIDRHAINSLTALISKHQIPALAAVFPPPTQSLNYVYSNGKACLDENRKNMRGFEWFEVRRHPNP